MFKLSTPSPGTDGTVGKSSGGGNLGFGGKGRKTGVTGNPGGKAGTAEGRTDTSPSGNITTSGPRLGPDGGTKDKPGGAGGGAGGAGGGGGGNWLDPAPGVGVSGLILSIVASNRESSIGTGIAAGLGGGTGGGLGGLKHGGMSSSDSSKGYVGGDNMSSPGIGEIMDQSPNSSSGRLHVSSMSSTCE